MYRAVLKQSNDQFAIKRFKEREANPHVRKIAKREAYMLNLLRHPNVVALHEVFCQNHHLHFVFEYLEKTVLTEIEQGALQPEYIKHLIYQLVLVVRHCHAASVLCT